MAKMIAPAVDVVVFEAQDVMTMSCQHLDRRHISMRHDDLQLLTKKNGVDFNGHTFIDAQAFHNEFNEQNYNPSTNSFQRGSGINITSANWYFFENADGTPLTSYSMDDKFYLVNTYTDSLYMYTGNKSSDRYGKETAYVYRLCNVNHGN